MLGCGSSDGNAAPAKTARPSAEATATASASPTATPAARRGVKLVRIGNFDAPLYVTAPPGDQRRVFVVEQGGRIWVVRDGRKLAQPFLDLSSKTRAGGEQGLLSMAFAPDYATSGRFYVDYTDDDGDSRVVEYRRASEDRADAGSARQVLFQRQPEPNHNGGLLLFGPDGLLYVGFGDGGGGGDQHGSRGNAQNLGTLLGKILRIDPRPSGGAAYSVPRSNPFVQPARRARRDLRLRAAQPVALLVRPRRPATSTIGDVGQDAVGGDRLRAPRRGPRARTSAGARSRAGAHYYPDESAPGRSRR